MVEALRHLMIQEHVPIKELFALSGKVAIVTGGASGIGFGCAKRLAEAGANIVIADFNPETGKKETEELINAGYKATFAKCDVTKESDVANVVETAVKTFGGLDIMVNNVGIYPLKPITEMDTETWDKVLNVNLKGTFLGCLKASHQMIKQSKGGSIINIVSTSYFHPTLGLTAYDASKGGAWMLTRTLALELAPFNIRVNSISPGIIPTEGSSSTPEAIEYNKRRLPRVAMGRFGTPEEVGNVALFLASPASSYITGTDIKVDAGWTLT